MEDKIHNYIQATIERWSDHRISQMGHAMLANTVLLAKMWYAAHISLQNVDLTKNFYYSHTYDIMHTLQRNWPLIHGYVDQSRLSIFGCNVYITLITCCSRIFTGVWYLKRRVNDAGYVANDIEIEKVVNTMEVISFDMPFNRLFPNPSYTAYVQHCGSIPLFRSQDALRTALKPPIDINVHDPYFVEAGRRFGNLFNRYGTPIIVLNLIKAKERARRELALGEAFSEGLHYLNQLLP
ncbi:phosphatidylinositol-3,5-bisphosphate 5-phosphatase [Coemansia sp. RSA 1646]|nr:phosphatidylinositol-3,5-bisphosphate 5-phosphatase [Coemansia sp. RSA 1646]